MIPARYLQRMRVTDGALSPFSPAPVMPPIDKLNWYGPWVPVVYADNSGASYAYANMPDNVEQVVGECTGCPGGGGGFSSWAGSAVGLFASALPPHIQKYAGAILSIVVSIYAGPALGRMISAAIGPALSASVVNELANQITARVISPSWFQQLPGPPALDARSLPTLQGQISGMFAGFSGPDPVEPIARRFLTANMALHAGDPHAAAEIQAGTADLTRLITSSAVALSLAFTNQLGVLAGHCGGSCGINGGWDPDQWMHWAMNLGPQYSARVGPVTILGMYYGSWPNQVIARNAQVAYLFEPSALANCLNAAAARVGAPGWLGSWLAPALQALPSALIDDWSVPLSRLVIGAIQAQFHESLVRIGKTLPPPQPVRVIRAPAAHPIVTSMPRGGVVSPTVETVPAKTRVRSIAPLLVGVTLLAKALTTS